MSGTDLALLDPLIEGYLSYLDKVGRKTPRTIVDVRCTLRRAVTALGRLRPGVDLWVLRLEDFLHWMEDERRSGRTAMSLAKYLSHVRGFLEYAWRSGRTTRNVLDGFNLQHSVPRTAPKFLTLEEAEQLVLATAGHGIARRDRLIILLLYGCGLRTNELCSLDVADVSRERQELTVRHGKGDRDRCIPIPEGLYTELLAYLLERGKRGTLFRTPVKVRRISAKDVCAVVSAAATRAGLRAGVTARTLRPQFRHPSDGSRRRPRDHRLPHGTSQSSGDRSLPARAAATPRGRRASPLHRSSSMKWSYWINLYVRTHCVARGLRPLTLAAYETVLEQFRDWCRMCRQQRTPDAITAADVLDYLQRLREVRGNGDSAVNRQLTILRSFYRAIVAIGHLDPSSNPLAGFPSIRGQNEGTNRGHRGHRHEY